nr:hypothetical protein GCM10020093_050100 [Planobispora longispora]
MDRHRRVHAVEDARLQQQRLAPAALLGGGADHLHGQAQLIGERCQRQTRPGGGGGDDVVPAGVAQPGSASYSAQNATVTGPEPYEAENAVGRPPAPASAPAARVTATPRPAR